MILEGIDEIRAQGVTVYPHVAGWDAEISVPVNVADVPLTALAWQLAQLDANEIGALARQLARADTDKANLLAEALWSEAMDVEHAALQADDAVMDSSNYRAVWGDSERHARIWDSIEAQLRAAQ